MPIEDVFVLKRGIVVVGRIVRGVVEVGDRVEIVGMQDKVHTGVVMGLEMMERTLKQSKAGDNVGCFLRGIERDEVGRGRVLAQPGSIKSHKTFEALIYVLSKEEGGRHTPFFDGYRPCIYVYTTDIVGQITLPDDIERVMPGDSVEITVELLMPVAMEKGTRFAIREGGRVVCVGICTNVR